MRWTFKKIDNGNSVISLFLGLRNDSYICLKSGRWKTRSVANVFETGVKKRELSGDICKLQYSNGWIKFQKYLRVYPHRASASVAAAASDWIHWNTLWRLKNRFPPPFSQCIRKGSNLTLPLTLGVFTAYLLCNTKDKIDDEKHGRKGNSLNTVWLSDSTAWLQSMRWSTPHVRYYMA